MPPTRPPRSPPPPDRALLVRLGRGPGGGDALAAETGVTRAAVWKRMSNLRAAGVAIVARPGQGYQLAQPLDLLCAEGIRAGLPPACLDDIAALEVAWSLDSTTKDA